MIGRATNRPRSQPPPPHRMPPPFRSMVRSTRRTVLPCAAALLAGCSGSTDGSSVVRAADIPAARNQLFTRLPSSVTGVRFVNRLEPAAEFNVFTYRNYYNGGGVAIGDLTGDGLPELVLTSNIGGARVYHNEGKSTFRDVTDRSGVEH